jgi:hypothetical protein
MQTARKYEFQISECHKLAAGTDDVLAKAVYEAMAAEFIAKSYQESSVCPAAWASALRTAA